MDQDFLNIDSKPFTKADSPHQDSDDPLTKWILGDDSSEVNPGQIPTTEQNEQDLYGFMDELSNIPVNEPGQTSTKPGAAIADMNQQSTQQQQDELQKQKEPGATAAAKAAEEAKKEEKSSDPFASSTSRLLYLRKSKEEMESDPFAYSKPFSFEWRAEYMVVKLPKLVNPPQRDDSKSKKDMEMDVNCKHPLSQWLMSNRKHQRDLIDFNGVVQSESRRKALENRWREEALEKSSGRNKRMSRWEMRRKIKEQHEKEAMKTEEEKEQERNRIVAHLRASCLDSSKHQELQKYMNSMQKESDDILEINMAEKANWESSVEKKKWKVIGLINPDAHLSTLDHSVNLRNIQKRSSKSIWGMGVENFDFVNYHHWIPTVFKVNSKGTECELLSQIPNLDPYRYKDSLYPMIAELFLHQLPSFENVLGFNLRDIPLRVIVKSQDYQLNDCSKDDFYLGNLHKEGLFEEIAAVGLYYYQIDDGIKGGELRLSQSAKGDGISRAVNMQICEGTTIVFRNDQLDHQVSQLYGTGSRKIISFFLLKQNTSHRIDASKITVNWKAHSRHFVENSLRNLQNTNALAQGNEWMVHLVQEYVVGNTEYIKNSVNMYRRCRLELVDFRNEVNRTVAREIRAAAPPVRYLLASD